MITSKQINEQEVTARDGARIRYERTGRRTDADLCSLRRTEQESRSEVLPDVHGRSSKQREPPRNPATEAMEQKQRENKNRERSSEIGSAALRPLHARCFLLRRPLPFIARKGAVFAFNSSPTESTRLILVCTYFVLTCFLARACVKSRFTRLGALIPLSDGFLHDTA